LIADPTRGLCPRTPRMYRLGAAAAPAAIPLTLRRMGMRWRPARSAVLSACPEAVGGAAPSTSRASTQQGTIASCRHLLAASRTCCRGPQRGKPQGVWGTGPPGCPAGALPSERRLGRDPGASRPPGAAPRGRGGAGPSRRGWPGAAGGVWRGVALSCPYLAHQAPLVSTPLFTHPVRKSDRASGPTAFWKPSEPQSGESVESQLRNGGPGESASRRGTTARV